MKKVVLGLIVLVLLAAAGAAFYITNIDWNQHKDKIAEQFYQLTGKTVSFDGRLSFKIFPSPYLNAVDAKIYNESEAGGKPLMEIKNVVAELSLMPLLGGEFHVKKMILDGVVINIDWDKGGLSWQNDLSPDQRQMMEDTTMVLNGVSLRNAEVNFEAQESGVDLHLTNLNGEVIAQGIFGPFRIEGNYLKGSTPEGFALSIGKLSENYATSLNMVVTHPQSDSYVRFDGSFHLINKVLNGNVIIESQQPSDFINANFADAKVPVQYNQPAALGFDIALNPQKLSLSNIVLKYGNTQGAGTLEMPLDNTNVPEIKTNFNFTDLELDPIVGFLRERIEIYKENGFSPSYPVDLTAGIKAVRASYDGQGLKELDMGFSLDGSTVKLDKLNVVLPGNTTLTMNGSVYPHQDELYFESDIAVSASDLMQTLQWLKIQPRANAAAVYKKMMATAKVAGTFDRIQISPYKITLDKSTLSGEAGIVLGERNDFMLVVNADTINFDNYISSLPEEEKSKSWAERMAYRFGRLGMLNDFDLVLDAKADLVIYENMPFEKVDFKGNVLNGEMEIEYAKVEQIANTAVNLSGKLGGFGTTPQMTDFQYSIKSNDIASLINKLELKVPDLDYKKFSSLDLSGTISGSMDNFGINTQMSLGQLSGSYRGTVVRTGAADSYDGDIEFKYPDFAELLGNFRIKYEPSYKNLGLLNIKSHLKGERDNFEVTNLEANIGYTTVKGSGYFEKAEGRPNIMASLDVNKLEVEKFLPKTNSVSLISGQPQTAPAAFLPTPFWSRDKIDYSPYIYFDTKSSLKVGELSYKEYLFKDTQFEFELVGGTATLRNFTGNYNNTPLEATASLYMREAPTVTAAVKIDEANVDDFVLGGKVYNLRGGKFSTRFDFTSKADSEESFAANLKGKAEFRATASELNGINLKAIYDDLIKRETPDGLVEQVKANIGSGKTLFNKINGRLIMEEGKFSLADVVMEGDNVSVKAYGEGNFEDWTMNTVFNVRYSEPKYLPEFSFSLKNGMDNPLVDVNVSSLFSLYQTREEQKEAAAAAEVEAEKNYWAGLMQEQQKISDDLVVSTRNRLEKDVEQKMADAFSPDSVNRYNLLKQNIAQTLAKLVEGTDAAVVLEPGEETVNKMKQVNEAALREIENFGKQRDDIYLADLQKQNETAYGKVVELDTLIKQDVFGYNATQDKYSERLAAIITEYAPDQDTKMQELKQKVEAKIAELEGLGNRAAEFQQPQNSTVSIADYEKYNQELEATVEALSAGRKELSDNIKQLNEYAEPQIAAAEKAYHDRIEHEENQRRVEENTGSISVKKTGRTFTVTRDIEEIKNAEEEISKEGVRVLDFSRDKAPVAEPEPDNRENVIKKGRNIR